MNTMNDTPLLCVILRAFLHLENRAEDIRSSIDDLIVDFHQKPEFSFPQTHRQAHMNTGLEIQCNAVSLPNVRPVTSMSGLPLYSSPSSSSSSKSFGIASSIFAPERILKIALGEVRHGIALRVRRDRHLQAEAEADHSPGRAFTLAFDQRQHRVRDLRRRKEKHGLFRIVRDEDLDALTQARRGESCSCGPF